MTTLYAVTIGEEQYTTTNVEAELLLMRCGGIVKIWNVRGAAAMADKVIAFGGGRYIPKPRGMLEN